jgi:hypothetical protein
VLSYRGEVRQGRQAIVAKLQEVLQQQQQQSLAGLQGSSCAGQARLVWRVGSVDSQQVAGVSCGRLHVSVQLSLYYKLQLRMRLLSLACTLCFMHYSLAFLNQFLTVAGGLMVEGAAVLSRSPNMPWRNYASLLSADCMQVDCVLVHVVGSIQAETSTAFSSSSSSSSSQSTAAAVKFTESFILARSSSGNYYIANQAFQLM